MYKQMRKTSRKMQQNIFSRAEVFLVKKFSKKVVVVLKILFFNYFKSK